MSTDDQAAGLGAQDAAGPGARHAGGPGARHAGGQDAKRHPQRSGDTGIHIGTMHGGAIATGEHGVAHSVTVSGAGLDPAQQKLLEAIADLRARLPQHDRSAEDSSLDAELSAVEGEITRRGAADSGLLGRALARLATYGPAAATAASVTAVIQAIAPLLGRA